MCRGRHLADDCVDRAEGEKEVNDRALYQLASPHKDTKVALRGFSFCDVGIAARAVASGENDKVTIPQYRRQRATSSSPDERFLRVLDGQCPMPHNTRVNDQDPLESGEPLSQYIQIGEVTRWPS